jgi:hypothetical protein
MKLNTINVIEYANDDILGVHSFSNNTEGERDAKICLYDIIKENGDNLLDEEIEGFVDEMYFEQGDYQVFLARSSTSLPNAPEVEPE